MAAEMYGSVAIDKKKFGKKGREEESLAAEHESLILSRAR